jgi:uncharacterized OB-fold protein
VKKVYTMNIAQNWRLNNQRYALQGARCEVCQQVTFPPRDICPKCAAGEQHEHEVKNAALTILVMPEMAGEVELRRAGR